MSHIMDQLTKADEGVQQANGESGHSEKLGALHRLQEALRWERFELYTKALDTACEFGATDREIEELLEAFLKKYRLVKRTNFFTRKGQ